MLGTGDYIYTSRMFGTNALHALFRAFESFLCCSEWQWEGGQRACEQVRNFGVLGIERIHVCLVCGQKRTLLCVYTCMRVCMLLCDECFCVCVCACVNVCTYIYIDTFFSSLKWFKELVLLSIYALISWFLAGHAGRKKAAFAASAQRNEEHDHFRKIQKGRTEAAQEA